MLLTHSPARRGHWANEEDIPQGTTSPSHGPASFRCSASPLRTPARHSTPLHTPPESLHEQVSDGAAAVVVARRSYALRRGLPILATLRAWAVVGVPPDEMGIGPAVAIPAALAKAGLGVRDVDLFELNEAFASQAVYCVKALGLGEELARDTDRINPSGGAIALGHPLGCTGARQVATLVHGLSRLGKRVGVVSMCIGTGMGMAAVFEAAPAPATGGASGGAGVGATATGAGTLKARL